jgi:hypothetical protein
METGGRGSTKSPSSSVQAVSHSRWRHIGTHIVSFSSVWGTVSDGSNYGIENYVGVMLGGTNLYALFAKRIRGSLILGRITHTPDDRAGGHRLQQRVDDERIKLAGSASDEKLLRDGRGSSLLWFALGTRILSETTCSVKEVGFWDRVRRK